ncbi:MAG TPA: GntR family transcriptional regulator [Solirubrobacterales bacterium]|nr:GntR family transcriptional regulator [Solirubrobacterales bacterium]
MNDIPARTESGERRGDEPLDGAADGGGNRRLDNRTLWEQVRDRLREEILSGELAPGTVLSETSLARSLGVSRGPIREALGRLASEGLVTITPRRGAIITELTRDEFIDAYQVREALETLAIRLAVPRLEQSDLARLRELHDRMVEHARRDEVKEFFDANAAFHRLLVTASGNGKLDEMYGLLLDQTGRYLARSLVLRGSLDRSISEHSAILEAVEAGDAERAAHLLADHIEVPQRVEEETGEQAVTAPLTTTEGRRP